MALFLEQRTLTGKRARQLVQVLISLAVDRAIIVTTSSNQVAMVPALLAGA